MKYKYFIKKKKDVTKVNALGEPLEYQTSYVICRTFVWVWRWLAELMPSWFIQYLRVADIEEARARMSNYESVEINWVSWMPSERFRYMYQAEGFLRRMKNTPDKFYTNI